MTDLLSKDLIKHPPDVILPSQPCKKDSGKKLVLIGSSTGGVEALTRIIPKLPEGLPPIVIVQHIPVGFSGSFASRLNLLSAIRVLEVSSKEVLQPSHAYIASGDRHLVIESRGNDYIAKAIEGEKVSRHKPSVDVLFRSGNNTAGRNTLAIILTGMGDDGSIGIKELYDNGAHTIAQDESSCIVFGMPKRAIAVGAIKEIVPLDNIAEKIIQFGKAIKGY
ncbi:chemotaxis protein CheB [Helicobacter monodelphidis]|uniref:CheB methylesterase domain-containing protein n=1 Tax=Helicobacter sp. 15-1451 TaxID=2004995 RepID=UPI000DCEA2EB|nr:CheB methylesterase domain-containing protein [Helicobacter sp. 15-1451]RAX58178.1 chemotaxis protein CheB [Helicobacter sp. 15-1451]